jgi:hypothetical protein
MMSPYQALRALGQSPDYFTREMRDEFSLLKQELENGTDELDFPWKRYEELTEKDIISGLHEEGMAKMLFRRIRAELDTLNQEINRLMMYPLTQANEPKQLIILNRLEKKREIINNAIYMLGNIIQAERELFRVAAPAEAVPTPKSPEINSPTLESLCAGDKKESGELAKKIDSVWEHVKGKTTRPSNYPAACAAVFRLVEYLGKVHPRIPASDWKAMLHLRYGVAVSEGIGKYRFDKANSKVFSTAVIQAFAYIKQHYLGWTAGKHLPAIYHELPKHRG